MKAERVETYDLAEICQRWDMLNTRDFPQIVEGIYYSF